MADVRSVAIAYWVGTGSRDEPDELAGASHFLEHLLFKGTERRSAAAIAEQLDEVGGDCNAFTTKEYTTFYIGPLSEHLPLGLDTLGAAAPVQRLTRDDIRAFFDLHYRPSNMVVSVAGDCTHEAVAAGLERRFAGTAGGVAPARTAPAP